MAAYSKLNSVEPLRCRSNSSSFTAILSVLEAADRRVESSLAELEAVIVEAEPDEIKFSAARMKVGQANLARRQIIRRASKHLARLVSPEDAKTLRDLQNEDVRQFQRTSYLIGHWTMAAVKADWEGYREASRLVRSGIRETILAEKQSLYRLLRQQIDR